MNNKGLQKPQKKKKKKKTFTDSECEWTRKKII